MLASDKPFGELDTTWQDACCDGVEALSRYGKVKRRPNPCYA
jgi:hypothetical protein